jgi:catechol-2,3-dioxygenase
MPVTGFSHYNLRAARPTLDVLRDFYVSVVGLRVGERPPLKNYGYWLYVGANAVLHLSEASAEEHRPANVSNTFDHVAFSCTGLAAVEAHLKACHVRYRSVEVPSTGQLQLFFRDPAGNGVELNFASGDI